MKIKEFKDTLLFRLELNGLDELQEYVEQAVLDRNKLETLLDVFNGLEKDYGEGLLQQMYQYYYANKEEFAQDFTSPSLAKLCAKLVKSDGNILDICAGFGQLTIAHHDQSEYDNHYFVQELDDEIIPWLLVNLAYHNINATVKHMNALTNWEIGTYTVEKSERYSFIEKQYDGESLSKFEINGVLCNPPYHIYDNYSFVMQAIAVSSPTAKLAFTLPKNVLTKSSDKIYRQQLVENGHLKAVILCPRSMYESTNIPVCILFLDMGDEGDDVTFMDCSDYHDVEFITPSEEEVNDFKNIVYDKKLFVFNDEQIKAICSSIFKKEDLPKVSKTVKYDEVIGKDFNFNPRMYF